MNFTVQMNTADYLRQLAEFPTNMARRMHKAVDAGGKVIQNGYRAALPVVNPPGYTSKANGEIVRYTNAFAAVGRRTLQFKDGTGAYCVVGIKAAPNNWRPLAPQAGWLEFGTDERHHKSGHYTGFVRAVHLLQEIASRYAPAAQATIIATLKAQENA